MFYFDYIIQVFNLSPGNMTAGNYTEKPKFKGLKQCVMGCCVLETCNVVFMHDTTCYHIECASNELCLPLFRSENSHLGTHVTMVLVSPVLEDGENFFFFFLNM